jgi:hypothetical protein
MMRFARRSILGAGKTPGWAGATPLFGLSAAQKLLGSLQPSVFSEAVEGRRFARVQEHSKLKEDTCQSLTSHRKS